MQARKLTLVEIGVGALPSVSPVAPRFSTWFPVAFKAPAVPPANGVTPTPVADGVVLEWDAVDLEGVIYVISRSESENGPWTEIPRTTETRYVYSDGSGKTWWFQITPTVRGKTGSGTVVGVTPPTTSTDLAEQQAKLAAEISARIQAIADEAAARAEGLAQAARDLVAEALLRQQGVTEALQAVSAEAQARIDAILNEKLTREAAITREEQLRQSADESLARAVSEVAAGSGTQFDSIKLWPFNQTTEGWTGNGAPTLVDGWLRPANHATAPWIQSPVALAIDGSAYRFVKLRVKRVGTPTWGGFLQWITATDQAWNTQKRAAIPEPAWDVNGVATVDVPDIAWWPATVDAIRLQLGTAQTVANYFLIDYVAVGRPQPGASVALVQEETQARITADAAEATQRNTLAVQMRGNYTGTDPAQLTAGLAYEELRARVAADSAQVQRISTMEARMPAGAGSLATAASVTALQEATATTTNALAQSITSLNVSLQNIGGDNLLPNSSFEESPSAITVPTAWNVETAAPAVTVGYVASPLSGGGRAVRLEATTGAANQWIGLNNVDSGGGSNLPRIRSNTDYVLSSYVRGSAGCTAQIIVQWRNAQNGIVATTTLPPTLMDGTWQRLVLPARTSVATADRARIYVGRLTAPAAQHVAIEIDNVMFQQGSVATNWTPSAAQLQGTINATASAVSGLTATVSELGNRVDSQSALITGLRSDVTDVSTLTAANAQAVQQLTTRTTTVEGKVETLGTSVTKLQAEMTTSLAGTSSLFPAGSFEQFPEGQSLGAGYGTTFTANAHGRRNGSRGLDINVVEDTRPDLNADCYPVQQFQPVNGVRRLYVEAYAALHANSVDIPADNTSVLRIGVQSSQAGAGGTGNSWPTINTPVRTLSKTAWTRITGYITTAADKAQARLFISMQGGTGTAVRVPGCRIRLDDITITDVTEVDAVKAEVQANATAITGLTGRVSQAEGKITAQADQLTDLQSSITSSFNRGENLNANPMFDGGIAPWTVLGASATNGQVTWVATGGQQGAAVQIENKAATTTNPTILANGSRWSPIATGKPGRKMRTVVVAKLVSGSARVTARCRMRSLAGEGNNDQTSPDLTTSWTRYVFEHPIGDDRTDVMSQLWVVRQGTVDAVVLVDRVEFYDISQELAITSNASAISGLSTTVTQQGSKLDATATDLTNLKTQVGDVNAGAFNQMQAAVQQHDGKINANAIAIQGVQAGLGEKADAAVVQTMEVQVRNQGSGGNLLSNSTFPNWAATPWAWLAPEGFGNFGNTSGNANYIPQGMTSALSAMRPGTWANGSNAFATAGDTLPAEAGKTYCISAVVNSHRCRVLFYAEFLNGLGQIIGSVGTPNMEPAGLTSGPISTFPRGFGIAKAPSGTVSMAVRLRIQGMGQADPYFWIMRPMLSEVAEGATQPPTWSPGGNEASARWGVDVRADKKIAGIALAATGETSSFDVLADVFRVSSPSGGQRTEYSDGNWRTYYPNGQLATRMGYWP